PCRRQPAAGTRPHDEFSSSCPAFAMVCPELVRVTGRFNRDRDREQAYPPPRRSPLLDRKSSTIQALTSLSARPVLGGSWLTCAEAGSLLVENSVICEVIAGFGTRVQAPPQTRSACGLWPKSCTFGQTERPAPRQNANSAIREGRFAGWQGSGPKLHPSNRS